MNRRILVMVAVLLFLIIVGVVLFMVLTIRGQTPTFNAQQAFRDVELQVAFGPRLPGSEAHNRTINWLVDELNKAGWNTEIQETTRMGHPIRNVIARRGIGSPWVILGAHFDSRLRADRDPEPQKRFQPVPGANDGASGVAVLLELARVLPKDLDKQVWLVFFDAEDQGDFPGWDWIQGSRAFAGSLTSKPDAVVVIDMIGDSNLNIFQEQNSDKTLTASIWTIAAMAGFQDYFIPSVKYGILDDHMPFVELGIPAVDIIDIEYRFWHTTADTPDKVSPKSLEAIGITLIKWLSMPIP